MKQFGRLKSIANLSEYEKVNIALIYLGQQLLLFGYLEQTTINISTSEFDINFKTKVSIQNSELARALYFSTVEINMLLDAANAGINVNFSIKSASEMGINVLSDNFVLLCKVITSTSAF